MLSFLSSLLPSWFQTKLTISVITKFHYDGYVGNDVQPTLFPAIELDKWDLSICLMKIEQYPVEQYLKPKLFAFKQALEEFPDINLANQVDNIYYVSTYSVPIFRIVNHAPERREARSPIKRFSITVTEQLK